MRFFFKKAFFIDSAIGFALFYGWTLWDLYKSPEDSTSIISGAIISTVFFMLLLGIPWFMAARSHILSGQENLKEQRGGIKYFLKKRQDLLKKQNKNPSDTISERIKKLDLNLDRAIILYNQEIAEIDRALGEYPNRFLVKIIFKYHCPPFYHRDQNKTPEPNNLSP